jgi:hypothetical protein
MKRLLLLLLLAASAVADGPVRERFPSDYKPQPCAADTAAVCKSFPQGRIAEYGSAFRGFSIDQGWVDAHWDEMQQLFTPFCAKIANCFTVKDNDWVYCVDLLRDDFLATCDRFPDGTSDRQQCKMATLTYYIGLGAKTALHKTSQECVAAQGTPAGPRKLEAWIDRETFTHGFEDLVTVYAYDAETHIPVRAVITVDAGHLLSTEGPVSTAGYPTKYRAALKRVTNAQGRHDVVAPTMTLNATGYETLTLPIAMDVPKIVVEVSPSPDAWKIGANTITVIARDAATGEPAEMRVLAGDRVLGKTNIPLQVTFERGKKRPEIWMTSLYDRYGDVVIAPAR